MKQQIEQIIGDALNTLKQASVLPEDFEVDVQVMPSKEVAQGDFASNVCLAGAKLAKMPPRKLAELLVKEFPESHWLEKVEIAGPGFINFFLAAEVAQSVIDEILQLKQAYGSATQVNPEKILLEFVSANPNGPLHVGHGRGAAYGATLANLLRAVGHEVYCEYYVNDAGRQMDILTVSVWLRYLDLAGETLDFPVNGYHGDYVWDIAATLHREHGERFQHASERVFESVCADAPEGDKEQHVDALIERAKALLGNDDYRFVFKLALDTLVDVIRRDLQQFGVVYENWFSEQQLVDDGEVSKTLQQLQQSGTLYEENGAKWFRSIDFGDEKNRVVVRDNGQSTYFASDIAYHKNKFDRGFDRLINIWGADHHGYIARVKASLEAIDYPAEQLEILLVQFANLYDQGEKIPMSTRSGEFVPLRTLREDVGNDAARFFYVMRRADQHMDFDLELARQQSADNPVYYVQYAHARICSVEKQMLQSEVEIADASDYSLLTSSYETALMKRLSAYPQRVSQAAERREPHIVINYLRELAQEFHAWYNAEKFLVEQPALRTARLQLALATRQVLSNGLQLMGVSAPQSM